MTCEGALRAGTPEPPSLHTQVPRRPGEPGQHARVAHPCSRGAAAAAGRRPVQGRCVTVEPACPRRSIVAAWRSALSARRATCDGSEGAVRA